jgi:hypothetical protein
MHLFVIYGISRKRSSTNPMHLWLEATMSCRSRFVPHTHGLYVGIFSPSQPCMLLTSAETKCRLPSFAPTSTLLRRSCCYARARPCSSWTTPFWRTLGTTSTSSTCGKTSRKRKSTTGASHFRLFNRIVTRTLTNRVHVQSRHCRRQADAGSDNSHKWIYWRPGSAPWPLPSRITGMKYRRRLDHCRNMLSDKQRAKPHQRRPGAAKHGTDDYFRPSEATTSMWFWCYRWGTLLTGR